jgi:DNA invertase Pin-like site-specific DNA recombinase
MGGYIAYYRVSTAKQGASGLGLEAQRAAVAGYLNGGSWVAQGEFTEVESGRKSARPELDKALAAARLHRIPLIVAKVDRLTRSVAFLSKLLEAGADVRFADLPALEGPTGRFMLQQMAAVAELEAGLISARTKAALKAAKARGVSLGGYRGVPICRRAQELGALARKEEAVRRAADVKPVIDAIVADPEFQKAPSYKRVADELNRRGVPTARGVGLWMGPQVYRVMGRLG